MLKKCYGLFLGLVVLAGSACVTPTHASSASVLIVSIRAGTQGSASEERVALYNNSPYEVEVTNWCLTNKASVKFACFAPLSSSEKIYLPGYSYASVVSLYTAQAYQDDYSVVYEPSSASSGSIVASADTVSLIDATNRLIDSYSWSSSIPSTQFWLRTKLSMTPDLFVDTDAPVDWQKAITGELLVNQLEYHEVVPEVPSEELPEVPIGEEPTIVLPLVITEVFPNAVGSDEGNEFIEIFNPNKQGEISLSGYKLVIGSSLEKILALPSFALKAGEYKVFTNTELNYTLLNTSSRVALLMTESGIITEIQPYSSPPEGKSWALIGDVWQYTNQPTPGMANAVGFSELNEDAVDSKASSSLKPCAANQERNLETNRCRLISSSSSGLAECKEGQERNLETNRCRSIASSTSTQTPCKEGQERNPETNRCRNIKQLATANFGVKGAKSEQQGGMGWYMWAAIGGIVLLIIGYAVWEWRSELKKLFVVVRAKFARKAN